MTSEKTTKPKKQVTQKQPDRLWLAALRRGLPVAIVVLLAAGVVAGLAALPIRTWVEQRDATAEIRQEVEAVEGEVAELELKLALLETDDEVERMARENFDLVYPGEESYRILPPAESR